MIKPRIREAMKRHMEQVVPAHEQVTRLGYDGETLYVEEGSGEFLLYNEIEFLEERLFIEYLEFATEAVMKFLRDEHILEN